MPSIDYHGRIFRSVSNSASGDVGAETTFHYRQEGHVVWATYAGGSVALGTLIARVSADGYLEMRYQHVASDGTIRTGRCRSRPELLPDGRVRLHETWQWLEGGEGSGSSVIEEVAPRD